MRTDVALCDLLGELGNVEVEVFVRGTWYPAGYRSKGCDPGMLRLLPQNATGVVMPAKNCWLWDGKEPSWREAGWSVVVVEPQ